MITDILGLQFGHEVICEDCTGPTTRVFRQGHSLELSVPPEWPAGIDIELDVLLDAWTRSDPILSICENDSTHRVNTSTSVKLSKLSDLVQLYINRSFMPGEPPAALKLGSIAKFDFSPWTNMPAGSSTEYLLVAVVRYLTDSKKNVVYIRLPGKVRPWVKFDDSRPGAPILETPFVRDETFNPVSKTLSAPVCWNANTL
jgi:hypothetical protein